MSLVLGDMHTEDWEDLAQNLAAIQTWAGKQEGINEALQGLSSILATVPTGSLLLWATATAPTGYLLCNGQSVSRTTYAGLYAVIGIVYGAGSGAGAGSNDFNVPDLRQRFPLGVAASGTGSTLAGTGGAIDHTHTGPSHTHTSAAHTHGIPGVTTTAGTSHNHEALTLEIQGGSGNIVMTGTNPEAAHTHNTPNSNTDSATPADTGASGTGATGTANPPFLALNYIIKT